MGSCPFWLPAILGFWRINIVVIVVVRVDLLMTTFCNSVSCCIQIFCEIFAKRASSFVIYNNHVRFVLVYGHQLSV